MPSRFKHGYITLNDLIGELKKLQEEHGNDEILSLGAAGGAIKGMSGPFCIHFEGDKREYIPAYQKDIVSSLNEPITFNNKCEVDLGYAKLIAYPNSDDSYKEVFVDLVDSEGNYLQDLAIIGGAYHYNEACEVVHDKGIFIKVWANEHAEEITNEFEIGVRGPKNALEDEMTSSDKASLSQQIKTATTRIIETQSVSDAKPKETEPGR